MKRGFLTKSRGRRRRRSGIALLVAMSTILVLTVVVTELTYTARVRFVLAAHEKERAQAEKTKYWSILGSILGTCIGIIGTTINNRYNFHLAQ